MRLAWMTLLERSLPWCALLEFLALSGLIVTTVLQSWHIFILMQYIGYARLWSSLCKVTQVVISVP